LLGAAAKPRPLSPAMGDPQPAKVPAHPTAPFVYISVSGGKGRVVFAARARCVGRLAEELQKAVHPAATLVTPTKSSGEGWESSVLPSPDISCRVCSRSTCLQRTCHVLQWKLGSAWLPARARVCDLDSSCVFSPQNAAFAPLPLSLYSPTSHRLPPRVLHTGVSMAAGPASVQGRGLSSGCMGLQGNAPGTRRKPADRALQIVLVSPYQPPPPTPRPLLRCNTHAHLHVMVDCIMSVSAWLYRVQGTHDPPCSHARVGGGGATLG
jgi:hypothetical protein